MSWGKVDPERLPDAVVCYADVTLALPLLTAYSLGRKQARPMRRLYDRRTELLDRLEREYREAGRLDSEGAEPALPPPASLDRHR